MAKVPSKHARDQFQDFEGLLNNLQDWESSFKDRDNKLKSQSVDKDKLDLLAQRHSVNSASQHSNGTGVNVKQPVGRSMASDNLSSGRQYDYLKDYDAIHHLSGGLMVEESVDANSEKELEAENDCTEALNLDDRYIKAYSRRSTARKELGKLKESIDDAAFALRLEPHNQEIKKQHAEVKSLLEKEIIKKNSRAAGGSSRGVQRVGELNVDKSKSIHEVQSVSISSPAGGVDEKKDNSKSKHKNGKQELKASVQEPELLVSPRLKLQKILPHQIQLISLRFLGGDFRVTVRNLQTRLLKVTPATALSGIFKNAFSAPMFVDIIRCIATFFTEDMDLGVKYLENLTKVPRFDMAILCLSPSDKIFIRCGTKFFSKGNEDYAENLGNLRSKFGVKQ